MRIFGKIKQQIDVFNENKSSRQDRQITNLKKQEKIETLKGKIANAKASRQSMMNNKPPILRGL